LSVPLLCNGLAGFEAAGEGELPGLLTQIEKAIFVFRSWKH
jgi:hypothetical protein